MAALGGVITNSGHVASDSAAQIGSSYVVGVVGYDELVPYSPPACGSGLEVQPCPIVTRAFPPTWRCAAAPVGA